MDRFEQYAAVPVRKSFLDQLVAILYLEKVDVNAIVSEKDLKFLSCKFQHSDMTENSSETSKSS